MADEDTDNKPEGSAATDDTPDSGTAAAASGGEAPQDTTSAASRATEKPVLLGVQPSTTEYIVTVDNLTGLPVKIETFGEGGARKELSAAEYARLLGGANPAATQAAAFSTTDASSLVEAYYRGVIDYLTAIGRMYG